MRGYNSFEDLRALGLCELKVKEPMDRHTSFKIGGPCDIFIVPRSEEGVRAVIEVATHNKLPLFVIGNGTNLLFPDNGFHGIVMQIGEPYFCDVGAVQVGRRRGVSLRVGAGISISSLLEITEKDELSGLEFISGIPGTLGGATVMNAGAYGKRISEVIERVKVMNGKGEVYWVKNEEIGFGYRESRFKCSVPYSGGQKEKWFGRGFTIPGVCDFEVILEAEIRLQYEERDKISSKIREILSDRESRLALDFPSAGCVFKNPKEMEAGRFIEQAGCKGFQIGDARVSTRHANFIVNLGSATYKDVKVLIEEVQRKVYRKFKVSLEPELIIL